MGWKKFLFPTGAKIAILVLALLIFGFPATMRSCPSFVEVGASLPPCVERFSIYPTIALLFLSLPALDASTTFEFNPLYIGAYVLALYLAACFLFHAVRQSFKKALLAVVGIALLLLLLAIALAIFGNISYIA